ncbi:MAG: BMP family protein [Bacillota bacterium]
MKKAYAVLLVAILVLSMLLTGCSGGVQASSEPTEPGATQAPSTATSEPSDTPKDSDLKVGLIVSGNVNDNGWCATAYAALLEIESRFGATINYVENVGLSDIEAQLINYGEDGYDIVFCHGYEYIDGVTKIAPNYLDTWFAVNSASFSQAPNALSVNQNNYQKGYLAGMVAALVSETGVIGAIGGTDIPPVQLSVQGAEAGAKYINPDITVLTAITGDNEDSTSALEVSNAMIKQKADVLIPVLGSAGLAVLTAAEENGIHVVGTNSDMHEFGPEVVITSSVAGFIDSMPVVVQALLDGTLEAKAYNFGVAEDVVKLAPFYQFEDSLPKATLDKIAEVIAGIKDGTIDTTPKS